MAKPRIHRILSALQPIDGDDRLLLDEVHYQDALGRPFECTIKALSKDHSINDEDLLGTSLTVKYEPKKGVIRYLNGIVSEVAYQGIVTGYSQYVIVTRPWFWFLSHTTDSRIFQEKTVPEIVENIFKDTHGFTDFSKSLTGSFSKRTYCSQYRESDFDFVSRLLEEEGIYYYFKHEEKKHTLVLVDDAASHKPVENVDKVPFRLPGDASVDLNHIWRWTINSRLLPTKVTLRDYDFEKPKADLEVNSLVSRKHAHAKFEKYDAPGRYVEKNDGNQFAKRRAEEEQVDFNEYAGASDEPMLSTGFHFKMEDHPRKDQNNVEYLITRSSIHIESAEISIFSARRNEIEVEFRAIKKSQAFRTHRTTPRPVVTGPQPAVVVGKSGEEIWTDKYGRIKVQFPWDREGKNDENSSCWIRVSHNWAGKGWGAVHIPRIGQEVLVEFLGGDPDRPIVTGRVYNADQTTPYVLPANQTQSGIKSQSTKSGKKDNFNELRFEDKKGEEEIYFHAEKNFQQIVENNAILKVGFEKKDKGNQEIEVHNDRTITVAEGNETIEIKKGDRKLTVTRGKETITVESDRTITVNSGNESIEVKKGDRTVKATLGKQTYQAMKSIELKVGASSIMIEPSKITIKAPQIIVEGMAKADVKAPLANVEGSAMLMLKGGIVKIN